MTPPGNDLRDAVAALRKEVRECIGETIPLRRRWVSAIIAGPITRLLTRALAAETDLAKARADLERVTAERDEAVAGLTQAAANIEKLSAAIHNAAPVLEARALTAEAENTRLTAQLAGAVEALTDMLAGWRYIREHHGDLYGVGWDRAEHKAAAALAAFSPNPKDSTHG